MELYISIFAAAVSLLALAFTVLTYYMGLRRQRKQATLDAYTTLQKEALDKLNTYTKKQIAEISDTASDPNNKAQRMEDTYGRFCFFCYQVFWEQNR